MFICVKDVDPSQDLYKIVSSDEKLSDAICIEFENTDTTQIALNIASMFRDYYNEDNIKYELISILNILLNYKKLLSNKKNINIIYTESDYINEYTPSDFATIIEKDIDNTFNDIFLNLDTKLSIEEEIKIIIIKYRVFLKEDAEEIILNKLKHNLIINKVSLEYNNYGQYTARNEKELKTFVECECEMKKAEIDIIIYLLEHPNTISDDFDEYKDNLLEPIYKKYNKIGLSDTAAEERLFDRMNKNIDIVRTEMKIYDL